MVSYEVFVDEGDGKGVVWWLPCVEVMVVMV